MIVVKLSGITCNTPISVTINNKKAIAIEKGFS